ncbi:MULTISPECIES: glycosyltransferase family 2 protein [unclassified Flavobacterium]|uniref:glycosyltransferase family 2 protein n=1 Tax=unclassified Flavobacterium TaxID=196869 RepID=UPI000962F715|nr:MULTISPECIES: glycosyltransferase family 2 protein [unclassified Flavobacterium]MBN9285828.1 glycosyltransferase family 2 protein [Flavobacterium sp.]OJV70108.1 MAG: glycosyl transferase [Flavobacterium sp. 40-81]
MLAIVIPYYKIAFFEETLRSLANQTDHRFKVYIGNDASPEDPSVLLKKFEDKIDYSYHYFEENLGSVSLVKQWQRCIGLVENEEWIMILGDDDFLEGNAVETWYSDYQYFKSHTNVVRFASKVIYEETKIISEAFVHPVWEKASDFYYRKFTGKTRSSLSEYIFTRKVYDVYGFHDYPLAWHSDDKAWIEYSEKMQIYTINDSCIYVRMSNENISGKKNNMLQKKKAAEMFLGDLITDNLCQFEKSQRLEFLLEYEKTIKDQRKLSIKEWSSLMYLYAVNFKPIPFLKFIRRLFIGIFSR